MMMIVNRKMLAAMARPQDSVSSAVLTVGMRPLNSSSAVAFATNGTMQDQGSNRQVADDLTIGGLQRLDGEYIILVGSP